MPMQDIDPGQETPQQRARRLGLATATATSADTTGGDETPQQRAARLGLASSGTLPNRNTDTLAAGFRPGSIAAQSPQAARRARLMPGDTRGVTPRGTSGSFGDSFMDRVTGAARAAGEGVTAGLAGPAEAAEKALFQPGPWKRNFAAELRNQRGRDAAFAQQHPDVAQYSDLAGALASAFVPGMRQLGPIVGGAVYGGVRGAADANPDASLGTRAWETAKGTALGGGLGLLFHNGGLAAGELGERVGAMIGPRTERFMSRLTGATPVSAAARARAMFAHNLETGGVSPAAAAASLRTDMPTSINELGSQGTLSLTRTARNVPGGNATQVTDRFLKGRAVESGERMEGALTATTGHKPTDTELPVEQYVAQARAKATPLYKEAESYGRLKDPETIAEVKRLLKFPIFQEGWKRGETMAAIEGSEQSPGMLPKREGPGASPDVAPKRLIEAKPEEAAPAPAAPKKTVPFRDSNGRPRQDLSKVSDKDLDDEYQKLAEKHAQEEGEAGGIEESGYRAEYDESPSMEKTGRSRRKFDEFGNKIKRQAEDLPDMGGEMDPDVLAEHNKTLAAFRKRSVARQAEKKLMARIQAELSSRPSAGDFEFGANKFVPNRPEPEPTPAKPGEPAPDVPGPTVRQMNRWKKGLDRVIAGKIKQGALERDEARVLRNQLSGVLDRVDQEVPAFAKARAAFKGELDLSEAAEAGAEHFTTKTPSGALERQLAAYSPGERAAYINNARNQLVEKIRNIAANPDLPEASRNTNIVQRLMGTRGSKERYQMLFPDPASLEDFLGRMNEESKYPKTNNFFGGTTTNRQQLESGTSEEELMGTVKKVGTAIDAIRHPARSIAEAIAKRREAKMSPETANEVGRIATLTGKDLQNVLREMDAEARGRAAGRGVRNATTRALTVGATDRRDWRKQVKELRHQP